MKARLLILFLLVLGASPAFAEAIPETRFYWGFVNIEGGPFEAYLPGHLTGQQCYDQMQASVGGQQIYVFGEILHLYRNSATNATVSPTQDTDGDGFKDWEEWNAGTNPNDPNSKPEEPPPPPVDPPTDTDGDGLPDALETMLGTNPNAVNVMDRYDHSDTVVVNDTPFQQKYEVRLETVDGFITLAEFTVAPGESYTLTDFGYLPAGAVVNLVRLSDSVEFADFYSPLPPKGIPEVHDPFQGSPGSADGSYSGAGAHNGGWGGGPTSPGGVGSAQGPGKGGDNTTGGTPGSGGKDGVLVDFYDKDTQPSSPNSNAPFIGSPGKPGDNSGGSPTKSNIYNPTINNNYNTGGGIGGNPGNGGNGGNPGTGENPGTGTGNGVSDAWAIIAFNNDFKNWGKGDGSSGEAGLGGVGEGAASTLLGGYGSGLSQLAPGAAQAPAFAIPFSMLDSRLADHPFSFADTGFSGVRELVRGLCLAVVAVLFTLASIRIVGGLL